jgi:hypothetical protein
MQFGDESVKFLAAQYLSPSNRLYLDIFDHHGPLPFLLSHLAYLLSAETQPAAGRAVLIALALMATASIYLSPIFKSQTAKIASSSIFLMLLAVIWDVQVLQMMLYQNLGGLLFTIVLSQLAMPLLLGSNVTRAGITAAAAAATLLLFAAYSFAPAFAFVLLLVILSTSRKPREFVIFIWRNFAFGVLYALCSVGLWMAFYSDWKGYFVYHFYFNQFVYSEFISFDPLRILAFLVPFFPVQPNGTIVGAVLVLVYASLAGILLLRTHQSRHGQTSCLGIIRAIAVVASVVVLNPRAADSGFHASGFVIAGLAFFSMVFGFIGESTKSPKSNTDTKTAVLATAVVLLLVSFTWDASTSPHNLKRSEINSATFSYQKSADLEWVREEAGEDASLLAIPFNPTIYISSGLPPSNGVMYYLPWQAAYERAPILNHSLKFCENLEANPPAVIWYDGWKVWDKYDPNNYAECAVMELAKRYKQSEVDRNFYFLVKDF